MSVTLKDEKIVKDWGTLLEGCRGKRKEFYQLVQDSIQAMEAPGVKIEEIKVAIGCIKRGWIIRNDIIWAKRNGMPEGVKDRFSKKHEYVFFMVKNKKYYFDLDSIRDKHIWAGRDRRCLSRIEKNVTKILEDGRTIRTVSYHKNGKNPGDVSDFWDIIKKSSDSDHCASFNSRLITKPIIAGCPKNGIVLDPFCGSGTTLARALELGRRFIGIDGKKRYCRMAKEHIEKIHNTSDC